MSKRKPTDSGKQTIEKTEATCVWLAVGKRNQWMKIRKKFIQASRQKSHDRVKRKDTATSQSTNIRSRSVLGQNIKV